MRIARKAEARAEPLGLEREAHCGSVGGRPVEYAVIERYQVEIGVHTDAALDETIAMSTVLEQFFRIDAD